MIAKPPVAPCRVLVCGGRDFANRDLAYASLDAIRAARGGFTVLIHGAARGADSIGRDWAQLHAVPVLAFPADWNRYGRSAGPVRNETMLCEGKPTLVVAFEGGTGTADMMRRAGKARVEVLEVRTLADAGVDVPASASDPRYLRSAAEVDDSWLPAPHRHTLDGRVPFRKSIL